MRTPQVGEIWEPIEGDEWGPMEILGEPENVPGLIDPVGNFKVKNISSGRIYPYFRIIDGRVKFKLREPVILENK